MQYKDLICAAFDRLKEQKPLIVNLTNHVVMNTTANALLAIGASPIMAHSQNEMTELVALSNALLINIGTLDSPFVDCATYAVEQANKFDKVIVIDPVGCGASKFRTKVSQHLAALADNLIIRANASEIIALYGALGTTRGVDAMDSSDSAVVAARELANRYHCTVVISGEIDYVVTQEMRVRLENGHPMMTSVTGMGCTLSALTAAFAGVGEKTGIAAAAVLGVVGELAAEQSVGPGSLQVNILDRLFSVNCQMILERLNISEVV